MLTQFKDWLKSKLTGSKDAELSDCDAPASLYDQLGGEPAIQLTVDLFYKRVLRDPQLMPFFSDKDMDYIKKKLVRKGLTRQGFNKTRL